MIFEDFVPLIAWFYLSIIVIISIGTFLTSVILSIQGRRQYGQLPALHLRYWFFMRITKWLCLEIPPQLSAIWEEMNVRLYALPSHNLLTRNHFRTIHTQHIRSIWRVERFLFISKAKINYRRRSSTITLHLQKLRPKGEPCFVSQMNIIKVRNGSSSTLTNP